ncbi:Panacea domain-containing protein [Sutterella megalosphaeroides]|uniref:Antitoxin SocA-like Panacea domain-containing protein n=1 Tax=Sutterella megalosphaeroides TaxID=2494234 RepID=A0A2Z6IC68_9BURK|nr:type II toxin-antitoxin system antitoxin SocA domain-containing protein [Sutterella megalosphaeroides]BBF23892.1 hypothetical protein SUTMEG_17830 [Sutterella megalosphaeroides]
MKSTALAPHDSLRVMAYLIRRCRRLGIEVDATKLQKLMYCCYGVCLAILDHRLCDESPEAWQYGPVFPRTLRQLKLNGVDFVETAFEDPALETALPEDVVQAVDQTLTHFGKLSAAQLSVWSHSPGSPWSLASDDGAHLYDQIPDATIRTYFASNVVTVNAEA